MLLDLEISQYIATKLCHDLAGIIGAISNGVDFIESTNPDMRVKAIDLIKSSSTQSVSRLVFFRHAYGVNKNTGEANLDELKKITEDYLKGSKISLNFHEKYFHISGVFISTTIGKLMLCLIQQACANLIHGGVISIIIEKKADKNIVQLHALGSSPKIDSEKHNIIRGKSEQYSLDINNCTSFFVARLVDVLGVQLTLSEEKDKISYQIEF